MSVLVSREWMSPARAEPRGLNLLAFSCVIIFVFLATLGAWWALTKRHDSGELMMWIIMAVIVPTIAVLSMAQRHRSLRNWAVAECGSITGEIIIFSDSFHGGPISSWKDWRRDHRTGDGALVLSKNLLEVAFRGSNEHWVTPLACVSEVRVLRLWFASIASPQLRLTFTDGQVFVAAVTREGVKGAFGVSVRRLMRIAEQIDAQR